MFLDNEIRLFYGGSDYTHYGWRVGSLCLATLRPDGFAGYQPEHPGEPAVVVTRDVPGAGRTIAVTADVQPEGYLRVAVLDANGNVLSRSGEIREDVTDAVLKLDRALQVDRIRLKFEFSKATVYSFKLDP